MLRHALLPLAFVALAACSGDKTEDTADTSSTTDTADTNDTADTEDTSDTGDSGTTSEFGSFSGTLSYVETIDGVTNCDADIALTGSAFSGDCADCTFAFAIDAEITRDGSTDDCSYNPVLTWLPDPTGLVIDPGFVFWETYSTDYGDYNNVAATSVGYYYYGYTYPGPYFQFWAAEGAIEGSSITKSGNDVTWSVESTTIESSVQFSESTDVATGSAGTNTIVCDGTIVDVWTLTVATAGTVTLTVDTVTGETPFDPVMWVNGADTCTYYYADDNVDCTNPPPTYTCPTWSGELAAGVYQLVVSGTSYDCDSGSGTYELKVDGATAVPSMVGVDAAVEDVPVYFNECDGATTVLTVTGSGTITP